MSHIAAPGSAHAKTSSHLPRDPDHSADERLLISLRLSCRGDGRSRAGEKDMSELSLVELDDVAGGLRDDGTNLQKWKNDISGDKLPWPVPTPGPIKFPQPPIVAI
jgi:hypothetical protein